MSTVQLQGYRELVARMGAAGRRHMPFAVAKALTQTAWQTSAAETAHIKQVFDKPTPFTQRAVGVTPATKAKLQARIFVKDVQAKYLAVEAIGGRRAFKTFEQRFAGGGTPQFALPGRGVGLNQYGNITKAKIKKIAADIETFNSNKRFFKGVPKGGGLPMGIYARANNNKHITTLIRFSTEATYKKRFEFSAVANETITANFEANLVSAWEAALRSG